MATWPSGKAEACKAFIPQFESGCRLFCFLLSYLSKSDWCVRSMIMFQGMGDWRSADAERFCEPFKERGSALSKTQVFEKRAK